MTGDDPLRYLLSEWWRQQRLPRVADLSSQQANLVLHQIEILEWQQRPM